MLISNRQSYGSSLKNAKTILFIQQLVYQGPFQKKLMVVFCKRFDSLIFIQGHPKNVDVVWSLKSKARNLFKLYGAGSANNAAHVFFGIEHFLDCFILLA